MAKKYIVELSADERAVLRTKISRGKSSAQAILKARILLKTDQGFHGPGWTDTRICEALETNLSMVGRVREKLVLQGLDTVFGRKLRAHPAITPIFDGEAEARLITLACSKPPEGYARWSVRLLADQVIQLDIVEKAHFNTVARVLKKTRLNRT